MNELKNKWSILVTNTHYVKTPEKQELCGDNPDLIEAYDHLHIQWIGTDEFIRRFSHIFTDYVHYENVPVVSTVLQNGLSVYAKLLRKEEMEDSHHYPHERLKGFLIGCFATARNLCRFIVVDKAKGEEWSLYNEMPLSLWRFNRADLSIEGLDIDHDEFTSLLYKKAVPENMKLAMRRFKHESAVMACDMDCRY